MSLLQRKAINIALPAAIAKGWPATLGPNSIMLQNVVLNTSEDEVASFHEGLKTSSSIEVVHFLAMFASFEDFVVSIRGAGNPKWQLTNLKCKNFYSRLHDAAGQRFSV